MNLWSNHLDAFLSLKTQQTVLSQDKIENVMEIAVFSIEKIGKTMETKYYCFQTKSSFFMASNAPHKRDAKRSARDFVTG